MTTRRDRRDRRDEVPLWVLAGLLTLLAVVTASLAVLGSSRVVLWDFVADSAVALSLTGHARLLLPTVLTVAALVLVVSTAFDETRSLRFAVLMAAFTASVTLTLLADTLPMLLLGWELMGACSWALIGFAWHDRRRVASGQTAMMVTRATDLGLYVAVAAAAAGGGVMELDRLSDLSDGWRDVALAGVVLACLGKAAQLPFSFWLARAMDGPSPVSALLHSAAMVAMGGYLMLRVEPALTSSPTLAGLTAWIGAGTAAAMGLVALAQSDLKQLLAASTAAQLGFVVLAAAVGAGAAGSAHLVAHAAVKALLFLSAGIWLHLLGTKQMAGLRGAARRWPVLGMLATAGLMSLSGLPPLSLWFTKDAILAGVLHDSPALYALGLVGVGLGAAYALKATIVLLAVPDSSPETGRAEQAAPPRRCVVALVPLALVALGAGGMALPPVLGSVPGETPPSPAPWELVLSAAVVVTTGLAVYAFSRRARASRLVPRSVHRWLRDWLGLERAVHVVVVSPLVRIAGAAAAVDDRILAQVPHRTAVGVRLAARAVGRADGILHRVVRTASAHTARHLSTAGARADRHVTAAVDATAGGARRSGRCVRRLARTGQLHHYYLQAVVGLLLVLVLLAIVALV